MAGRQAQGYLYMTSFLGACQAILRFEFTLLNKLVFLFLLYKIKHSN